jgi:IS30 family transposase
MGKRVDHGHRLTEADRFEMQRRITAGETFAATAAAVGCSTKSIQRFMRHTGGMRPKAWNRSLRHLSLAEREDVLRGLLAGHSFRQIAAELGRSPSTISREVGRNGRRRSYRVSRAENAAARHARRPKPYKLIENARLRDEVERRLAQRWSPQQISARLVRDYPDDAEMRCRTRRSTGRCSSRHAVRCGRSSRRVSAPVGRSGGRTSAPSTLGAAACARWS